MNYQINILNLSHIFRMIMILLVFLSFGCKENEQGEPIYLGTEYYGFQTGRYIIYNIDSIVYDDFLGETFQYQYQVKELLAGKFLNSSGDSVMRIERFWRNSPGYSWQVKDIWVSEMKSSRAVKTEENVSYIKLAFPIQRNQSWNGNAYNEFSELIYTYEELHQPYETSSHTFDSTLKVMQNNFSTLISEDLQYEIYANGLGMIYKKYLSLEKDIDGTIISGVDYSYEITDFGYE